MVEDDEDRKTSIMLTRRSRTRLAQFCGRSYTWQPSRMSYSQAIEFLLDEYTKHKPKGGPAPA